MLKPLLLSALLMICLLCSQLKAQETIAFTGSDKTLTIGKKALIFYDSTGVLTPEKILSVSGFYSSNNKIPAEQVKKGNIWIKVAIQNLSHDSTLFFNLPYSNISNISIFQISN